MQKIIILLICIFLLSLAAGAQSTQQQLDELISAYVKRGDFSGTALVARHDSVLLEKGYGPGNTPMSIYQIASVTKTFTATLVLKLAELKMLSLKDKLNRYYPDYPHGDSITIEQLLSHTSGIYNYTNNDDFMRTSAGKPTTEQAILALFEHKPLDFSPGSKWNYSNSGYMLLGYIIQKVTGLSYQQAMKKYIFTPLKMEHSGFDFIHLAGKEKTTGYYADSGRLYNRPAPVVDSSVSFAAGSIYSTVKDLYRWHKGLQQHAIISEGLQEQAYAPHGQPNYGYGWMTDSIYGRRMLAHSGGIWGFRSNFARVPADDVCVVLLSNTETPALDILTRKILAVLYHKPYKLPVKRTPIHLSIDVLKRYTGTYEISEKDLVVHINLEDNELVAYPNKGPRSVMMPENDTHFFLRDDEEIETTFVTDESGRANAMIIHQRGTTATAKRTR